MRLLVADIETAPNLMHVWSLFQKGPLNHNMVLESKQMISFASKWVGESDYQFGSLYHTGQNQMVQLAWQLLDECDAIIHYNGKRFDVPLLNREFILRGYGPPSPYRQIDIYSTVRSRFEFTSSKLDFVCQDLGIGKKVAHEGYDLWAKCVLDNDPDAWNRMKEYNIGDVTLTEQLYFRMLPWIEKHPSFAAMENAEKCINCGSLKLIKQGFAFTLTRKYQRLRCTACGKWMRSTRSEKGVAASVTEVQSG